MGGGGGEYYGRTFSRDLFPLKLLPALEGARAKLSRGVAQKVGKQVSIREEVNSTIDSLNWLAGTGSVGTGPLSAVQAAAVEHIEFVVRNASPHAAMQTTEEACHALLGTGLPYGGDDAAHLAQYDPTLLSVPQVGAKPVKLAEHLPEPARKFLVHFEEHLLVSDEEWGHITEAGGHQKIFTDPKLKHSPSRYFDFIERLFQAGLLRFSQQVRGRIGAFFVKKKNGKIRLVLECADGNWCCMGRPLA